MGIEPELLPKTDEVPAAQRKLFTNPKKTPNLKKYTYKQILNLRTWKRCAPHQIAHNVLI